MTFGELRIRYSHEELTRSLGDPELRYRVCAPFFQNLFESKVVYYEKFIGVVLNCVPDWSPGKYSGSNYYYYSSSAEKVYGSNPGNSTG